MVVDKYEMKSQPQLHIALFIYSFFLKNIYSM